MGSNSKIIVTPKFRMSYPNLLKRGTKQDGSEGPYSVVMVFPKTADLKPLREAMMEAITSEWPKKQGEELTKFLRTFKPVLRDGDVDVDKNGDPKYPGCMYATACAYNDKPGLIDMNSQPVIDPEAVYAGRWARAAIQAYTYDKPSNGVTFGLIHVQVCEDADRFGAPKPKAEDVFKVAPLEPIAPATGSAADMLG